MSVKNNPKISVIMSVLNAEKYLRDAIDSIVGQTYDNWEFVICDDCSTDSSWQILEEYKEKYPTKFILLKNDINLKLSASLNKCLSVCSGEYIARMDADDISKYDRFEKQVAFLDRHPEYAIVSTPMIYFDDEVWGQGIGKGEFDVSEIAKGTPFCHAPCMVRKEAYDAVSGYDISPKYLRVEDYNLWIDMLAKGYKGYNLKEPLYMMRDDKNAITRRKYRFRINEARVRAKAIKTFRLNFKNYIYVFRPLIVGLLPVFLYKKLHQKRFGTDNRISK